MAGLLEPSSQHGPGSSVAPPPPRGRLEEPDHSSSNWYFTREEIEKNSPSRKDGIDLKKETYFRKSYCTFLQDLGMRLKVPQVTIATAIVFCHRFFLRQSHAKNDRYTIATACMFLAGKVEETPQSLKNVILVSYETRNKKDQAAIQRIKQKEVYEQQKELIVLAERVVLATLGFDLNVHHPYKPLVAAIKKFKVAQNALAQVAWNFVNDGLRTSLCLQFKPHHIAAGAIFLAAKFLKVKLPSDGEVVWWQEFDVTPLQLEDVSNQMLELYEQNKPNAARGSEVGGSSGNTNQNLGSQSAAPSNGASQFPGHRSPVTLPGTSGLVANKSVNKESPLADKAQANNNNAEENTCNNLGGNTARRKLSEGDDKTAEAGDGSQLMDPVLNNKCREKMDPAANDMQKTNRSSDENKGKHDFDDAEGKKSWGGLDVLNKDKVKAALEKRRRSRGEGGTARPSKPKDVIDEDDLIERELESGVEAAAQAAKVNQERRDSWRKLSHKPEQGDDELRSEHMDDDGNVRKRKRSSIDGPSDKRLRSYEMPELGQERNLSDNYTEEGELPEMSPDDQVHSPRCVDKRSASPSNRNQPRQWDYGIHDQQGNRENSHEGKHRHGNHHFHHSSHYHQQYRADADRERHYVKDRDKHDRDYKKSRHDHGKWD